MSFGVYVGNLVKHKKVYVGRWNLLIEVSLTFDLIYLFHFNVYLIHKNIED